MESIRELSFLVEEKRTAIDVYTEWLPRLAVVFGFVLIGATKFSTGHGEWYRIFELIGLGQWFRYFTGAVQVLGAILMLARRTRTIGAAMLACTMVGAMVVDVFIAHAVGFAFAPLVLLGIVAATWFAGLRNS
jgi:putative oxidoreductase